MDEICSGQIHSLKIEFVSWCIMLDVSLISCNKTSSGHSSKLKYGTHVWYLGRSFNSTLWTHQSGSLKHFHLLKILTSKFWHQEIWQFLLADIKSWMLLVRHLDFMLVNCQLLFWWKYFLLIGMNSQVKYNKIH